jgi:hypothetical protein
MVLFGELLDAGYHGIFGGNKLIDLTGEKNELKEGTGGT